MTTIKTRHSAQDFDDKLMGCKDITRKCAIEEHSSFNFRHSNPELFVRDRLSKEIIFVDMGSHQVAVAYFLIRGLKIETDGEYSLTEIDESYWPACDDYIENNLEIAGSRTSIIDNGWNTKLRNR